MRASGVSRSGNNLPRFKELQLDFAAHLRDPEANPPPAGIEPRRMQIYQDLVYNNVESFLASSFPITKQILSDVLWHTLVRDFLRRHPSESPYFLDISQEFLTYLERAPNENLPPFMLELCHYEWVELALSVAEEDIRHDGIDPEGDLLTGRVVVSPLIWPLAYRFPVHKIGPGYQPAAAPPERTCLVVYRRGDDRVKFLEVNEVTLRLIELLRAGATGEEVLGALQVELAGVDSQVVHDRGVATMKRLRESEVILGTEIASAKE